jgi:hypothetical protein
MYVPFSYHGVPILPILAIVTVAVMVTRLDAAAWLLGGVAVATGAAAWRVLAAFRPSGPVSRTA